MKIISLPHIAYSKIVWHLTSLQAVLVFSLVAVLFYNLNFFSAIFSVEYTSSWQKWKILIEQGVLLWLATFMVFSWLTIPWIAKPLFIILFIGAAITDYFMSTYGVVIHAAMIQNLVETDTAEVADLISPRLFLYILVLGLIPALLISRIQIRYSSLLCELWLRIKITGLVLVLVAVIFLISSATLSAFFREHKSIRQMANPLNFIYAGLAYGFEVDHAGPVTPLGTDARLNVLGQSQTKPVLLLLVVGETARADHFSINGYSRDTTPLIAQQNIINFPHVTSCGTETAVSVPCMMSNLTRQHYSDKKAKHQESVLDVLHHAGIDVFWRDNNSSCKGACDRVGYENIQQWDLPALCNGRECYDQALLEGLTDKLHSMASMHKIIVLHQKGSHGPDYFNRYPDGQGIFTPECRTNQLQTCTTEEVVNAYDNSIRYTDFFLNASIQWLKLQTDHYNTAMIYLSDHGESLGENRIYLHGMPYMIAPDAQKQVPFFLWLSDGYALANKLDVKCLRKLSDKPISQDYLFHSLLGMSNVETQVYKPELDITANCRY